MGHTECATDCQPSGLRPPIEGQGDQDVEEFDLQHCSPRGRIICGVRTFLRSGLMAIAVCAAPVSLWSQVSSSPLQTSANTDQPFTAIDDSLTRAADTLLSSADRTTTAVAEMGNVDEAPTASLAIHVDRRPQAWSDGSGIAASHPGARLEVLRPVVDPILRNHGVPVDLAAVVLVESGARADALSPKGARGLWQLMPETARRYGLRVDDIQDDRLDLFKATDAAASYLHDLYAQFGDWKLALAAYNTGEANVGAAILKAHTQDFDQLTRLGMLPHETRNYVPRVLAAAQSIGLSPAYGNGSRAISATTVFAVSDR